MNKNILIVDGYSRNSLALLRSLGKEGFHCDIIVSPHKSRLYTAFEKAMKSKFVKKVYTLKKDNEEDLLKGVLNILNKKHYSCLLAGGTYYSNFISKHKSEFSKFTQVLSEDYLKMQLVHDKESCMKLASKLNIPIPKTFVANCKNDLIKIAKEIKGNAIVKLSDSYASKGLVKYTKGEKYFIENFEKDFGFDFPDNNKPLIQELIEGDLIDSTAFSINGETKAVLTQKRELTAWLEGGGGIVNITTDHEQVKIDTMKILSYLNWTGHIEMDWIENKSTGKCHLIEINPKFWGTTQLTISSGLNYPLWYVKYALGKNVEYTTKYKVGFRYRWLDDELITVFTQPKTFRIFIRELNNSLLRFFAVNTSNNFYIGDWKPFAKGVIDSIIIILKSWTIGKK